MNLIQESGWLSRIRVPACLLIAGSCPVLGGSLGAACIRAGISNIYSTKIWGA